MGDKGSVQCDACAGVFAPAFLTTRKGELEYQYFCCPYCNRPYIVSVTDEELRRSIREYLAIGEKIRRDGETESLRKESLEKLRANVRRSGELLSKFPMEAE
jgi:hypothetical protein